LKQRLFFLNIKLLGKISDGQFLHDGVTGIARAQHQANLLDRERQLRGARDKDRQENAN